MKSTKTFLTLLPFFVLRVTLHFPHRLIFGAPSMVVVVEMQRSPTECRHLLHLI